MNTSSRVTPPPSASPATQTAYREEHQKDMTTRLRRIEGQVRGIIAMIEAGRSCDEVATQMLAARKAMDKAFYRMVTCSLIEAVQESPTEEKVLLEVERSARLLEKFA